MAEYFETDFEPWRLRRPLEDAAAAALKQNTVRIIIRKTGEAAIAFFIDKIKSRFSIPICISIEKRAENFEF